MTASPAKFCRPRYYDPVTGRWLSADPLGLGPDINPYRYGGNNAINATDPSGLAYGNLACWLRRIVCGTQAHPAIAAWIKTYATSSYEYYTNLEDQDSCSRRTWHINSSR